MNFASEWAHLRRSFLCGWSARAETHVNVARRVQSMAKAFRRVDPAFGELRAQFEFRAFRYYDPGPVLTLTPERLGGMIDRQGRYEPPQLPRPVGPRGYSAWFWNDRRDERRIGVGVRAGDCQDDRSNQVEVEPSKAHFIWQQPERAIELMHAMIDAWDPEWAAAYAFVPGDPAGSERGFERPWLVWTSPALRPRPKPPYFEAYQHPMPFPNAGPPAEVRPDHGGELKVWP